MRGGEDMEQVSCDRLGLAAAPRLLRDQVCTPVLGFLSDVQAGTLPQGAGASASCLDPNHALAATPGGGRGSRGRGRAQVPGTWAAARGADGGGSVLLVSPLHLVKRVI